MKYSAFVFTALTSLLFTSAAMAAELKLMDPAPVFKAKTHEGKDFDLNSRKDKWTVLYFYPKAGTPGCTKQACAFRDNIEKIRGEGAEVYGISADTVEAQAKFHKDQHLNFTLLADPENKVIEMYGTKMPAMPLSKRWTFIVGPNLKIRHIAKDVDPVTDAEKIAAQLALLKAKN